MDDPDTARYLLDTVLDLGKLALKFGRTYRATFHEDGDTPESDTDHTVMLGLVAMALCPSYLDRGLVAQYVMIHDLIEAYEGDTNTFGITAEELEAKEAREARAFQQLCRDFEDQGWLLSRIVHYENQKIEEARFVRYVDKMMPKITHVLNQGESYRRMGKALPEIKAHHDTQFSELSEQYPEFSNTPLGSLMLDLMKRARESYVVLEGEQMAPYRRLDVHEQVVQVDGLAYSVAYAYECTSLTIVSVLSWDEQAEDWVDESDPQAWDVPKLIAALFREPG